MTFIYRVLFFLNLYSSFGFYLKKKANLNIYFCVCMCVVTNENPLTEKENLVTKMFSRKMLEVIY